MVDRRYYKKQDELISAYEGIHLDNSKLDSDFTRNRLRKQATLLAKVSFFMNFVSRPAFTVNFHSLKLVIITNDVDLFRTRRESSASLTDFCHKLQTQLFHQSFPDIFL